MSEQIKRSNYTRFVVQQEYRIKQNPEEWEWLDCNAGSTDEEVERRFMASRRASLEMCNHNKKFVRAYRMIARKVTTEDRVLVEA